MNICFILGTRPEIIKLSPLIKLCKKRKLKYTVIHTGQHFEYNMEGQFFKDLSVKPNYFLNLNTKKNYNKNFMDKAVSRLVEYYQKLDPDYIVNQGDTNTVLASALAYKKIQNKIKAKLVHVEAGIRSFDKKMPEEINRIKADKISDILLAPTKIAKKNLTREKLTDKKIYIVGNTIADTIKINSSRWKKKVKINENYFFLTLHRPETVDNLKNLKTVIKSLIDLSIELKTKIIFPIHPRTRKKISKININNLFRINIINPCSYFDSLTYQKNAKAVITDSGGMQEEACILKKPCITIRKNTERPETIKIKSNILTGYNYKNIKNIVRKMINNKRKWKSPYGKNVSNQIIRILYQNL